MNQPATTTKPREHPVFRPLILKQKPPGTVQPASDAEILVSIIVPVFNGAATIHRCIDALLAQEFTTGRYEIIIVDNGSTDETWSIIESYGSKVRGVSETLARGSYAARNTGVREARGKILAFTDSDCIPDPAWLCNLITGFSDENVGCVGGEIIGIEPTTPAEKYAAKRGILSQQAALDHSFLPFFQTANAAYRREIFDAIGDFDATLKSGGDADFCWRMQRHTDWKFSFRADALVLHHHRTSWRSLWKQFERYGSGNAHLHHLYPDFQVSPYESLAESARRLLRFGRQAARYSRARLSDSPLDTNRREALETSFYSLVTQAAFAIGKRRADVPLSVRSRSALTNNRSSVLPDAQIPSNWGVSVVICCHNGARRLPQTLGHLSAQIVDNALPWEVIVVDNVSTDGTAEVAFRAWPENAPAPLRVVHEDRLGSAQARYRGIQEAKYELISFVDDDNWVCPEWVQTVAEVMKRHPDAGACGGFNEPAFDRNPPRWFEDWTGNYAIGAQGETAGDVTDTRGWLWTAGFTTRKSVLNDLSSRGYQSMLPGRKGAILSGGEDIELCYALRLAGWRLWYEPRLRLRHFLPAHRLTWNYLRQLHYAFGATNLALTPYRWAAEAKGTGMRDRLKRIWCLQIVDAAIRVLRCGRMLIPAVRSASEGNEKSLQTEREIGRLSEILRQRSAFNLRVREIETAPWKRNPVNQYAAR